MAADRVGIGRAVHLDVADIDRADHAVAVDDRAGLVRLGRLYRNGNVIAAAAGQRARELKVTIGCDGDIISGVVLQAQPGAAQARDRAADGIRRCRECRYAAAAATSAVPPFTPACAQA